MRVVTRKGSDGTAITSRASTSSEMRMAPSCAVKPQPTVADSAMAATKGEISRVLKYAEMKPVNALLPSWLSAWYPCRPTSVPVKKVRKQMTPTVPPTTASAPVPKLTSASSRMTSRRYRRSVRGTAAAARAWNSSCAPRSSRITSTALLRDDLEVDRGDHEVQREQQHEGDDHALVDRVADALRPAPGRHSLVGGHDRGHRPEHERLDLAGDQVGRLPERLEAGQVGTRGTVLEHHVEQVAAGHAHDADQPVEQDGDHHRGHHPGYHQALHRVDAQHLHGVELLADLPGAQIGADGRPAVTGDHQRRHDRPGLPHHSHDRRGLAERLRAELPHQGTELQRDHRAERDGDQRRRQDGHRADEPRLLDELPHLERPARQRPQYVDAEPEQVPRPLQPRRDRIPHTSTSLNDPNGGTTPLAAHHAPGARSARPGSPSDGWSWNWLGGSGGRRPSDSPPRPAAS